MGSDEPRNPPQPQPPAHDDEPLQARGPDPRDEQRSDETPEDVRGKAAGGVHRDKTPSTLVKQPQTHRDLEKGRPKDTGRAGA